MRNEELDKTLRQIAPVEDARLEDLDFDALESELLSELDPAERSPDIEPEGRATGWFAGWFKPTRLAAAGTALALVVVAALWIGLGSSGSSGQPEFADAAVRVAEANARLLVTLPDWRVTRADSFEVDQGEMEFGDGRGSTLQLTWYPADQYEGYYKDRSFVDPNPKFFDLLGEKTRTVSYSAHDFATMLPPDGQSFIELRGEGLSYDEYLKVIRSIESTDVDTWLSAMPGSVVTPGDRAGVVDTMVSDMPLPAGFDLANLEAGDTINDRYQLGAQVSGAVACSWLDIYTAATIDGDTAKADDAAVALATSHNWAILKEMKADGAYPDVLWDFADAAKAGAFLGPEGHQKIADDPSGFRRWYSPGLGCPSVPLP